jgi:GT2 family glycosyltransferase
MNKGFTIIVPTKNRCEPLNDLLNSLKKVHGLTRIRPEIIVGDNASTDRTWAMLQSLRGDFPVCLEILRVATPGKSAVMNEAVRRAKGEVLAFLDDDVVVDQSWLEELEGFFQNGNGYLIGQGVIRIPASESQDPEIRCLLQRYRTVPQLEFDRGEEHLHSLNGANIAIRHEVFDRVGGFAERLGPGASGTSEDVELARRILQAGMKISYMPSAIVYHRVDRDRLTEEYFKQIHWRQGGSRFLMRRQSTAAILFNLVRAATQCIFYTLIGKERNRYRSKGRIYHYLGMIAAKRNGSAKFKSNELL